MPYQNDLLNRIARAASEAPSPGFGLTGAAMIKLMGGTMNTTFVSEIIRRSNAEGDLSDSSLKECKGLVSKDDLLNIFKYIDYALALPKNIPEAEQYLGYKKDDDFFKDEKHQFLTPEHQVEFDLPIIAHAQKWAGLEQGIKNTGVDLDNYARKFVIEADNVLSVLQDLDQYLRVHGFVDENGKEIVKCGTEMLEAWQRDTERYHKTAERLYENLQNFDNELENNIKSNVEKRIGQIDDMNLDGEIKKLNEQIKNLKNRINDLQKLYDKYVGLAFTGAAGMIIPGLGIISWAITGGIYGKKAEDTRKQKNEMEKELEPLEHKLAADGKVIEGINHLSRSLVDVQSSFKAAILGVQHINTAWKSVVIDIEGALNALKNISDPQYVSYVKSLITQLRIAKNEWSDCGSVAKELVDLFDEARKEHKS